MVQGAIELTCLGVEIVGPQVKCAQRCKRLRPDPEHGPFEKSRANWRLGLHPPAEILDSRFISQPIGVGGPEKAARPTSPTEGSENCRKMRRTLPGCPARAR